MMDGVNVCEKHDDDVVLYKSMKGGGSYRDCPLCAALAKIEELEDQLSEQRETREARDR